ncbi:unnamed protein product [Fusarium venenatum]|uniref:Uncharacterized protein n=1 Tax=Fusarium venenatum TaxID=56646 RepID=A0A2L2T0P7_9HYPO|nr:uncharacterized protein FVRRES_11300 [Fusarium venenatum]CEI38609.1 unnamed protein product [Fusarium venenatum]
MITSLCMYVGNVQSKDEVAPMMSITRINTESQSHSSDIKAISDLPTLSVKSMM